MPLGRSDKPPPCSSVKGGDACLTGRLEKAVERMYKSLAHLLAPRTRQKKFPLLKLTLYLCHMKLPLDVGNQDSRYGTAVCT